MRGRFGSFDSAGFDTLNRRVQLSVVFDQMRQQGSATLRDDQTFTERLLIICFLLGPHKRRGPHDSDIRGRHHVVFTVSVYVTQKLEKPAPYGELGFSEVLLDVQERVLLKLRGLDFTQQFAARP